MTQPVLYQRLEAAFIFALCVFMYAILHFHFVWFFVLLFTIDIFMLGYLVNKQVGAHVYNIGHSFFIPASFLIAGMGLHKNMLVAGGIIWAAHIGWDRALGYGLKFSTGFKDTHLGHIGKKKAS